MFGSLTVNSPETPIGLGGYDRPPEIVFSLEDVERRYRETARPVCVCGYCDETARYRDKAEAHRWFRTHACSGEGEQLDQWHAA